MKFYFIRTAVLLRVFRKIIAAELIVFHTIPGIIRYGLKNGQKKIRVRSHHKATRKTARRLRFDFLTDRMRALKVVY